VRGTYNFATCCPVCNSINYGFSQKKINVTNPNQSCYKDKCDGNGYLIYQTTNEAEARLKNEALNQYQTTR
jgi:hypothetical protein